jgi:acetyl esterase/lipase
MHKNIFYILFFFTVGFSPCAAQLRTIVDKSTEQIAADYQILRDVAYGSDKEQVMDIYISKEANKLKRRNFTIVFVHGGGYYVSDKSQEEKYIEPYLKKGLNVVNMNYRLKRGIPAAMEDLANALNFLKKTNRTYHLNLSRVILTGFSAGAHMASNAGVSANNHEYTYKLEKGIGIAGVINFSGPVDGLNVVERVFIDNDAQIMKDIGNALFPTIDGYAPKDSLARYEPITYFDKNDPPFFLWHGGRDDQIPSATFEAFVGLLNMDKSKNKVIFSPGGVHSPNEAELKDAYEQIFIFLDHL